VAGLFGVRRTPLSGSNSGRTSGDFVVGRSIYGEVKRNLIFSRALLDLLPVIADGKLYVRVADFRGTLVVFRLDTFLKAKKKASAAKPECGGLVPLRNNSILRRVYWESLAKAKDENFPACLLVCRVHDHHGFFAVANLPTIEVLKRWLLKRGKVNLPKTPEPSEMSSPT